MSDSSSESDDAGRNEDRACSPPKRRKRAPMYYKTYFQPENKTFVPRTTLLAEQHFTEVSIRIRCGFFVG